MAENIPEDKVAALRELLFRGRKIEAIRLYRGITGLGLKEAKDSVDALERSLRAEFPDRFAARSGRGCLGAATLVCVCAAGASYWLLRR